MQNENCNSDRRTRVEQARDLILADLDEHDRDCPRRSTGEWCPEKANALAYLAHCLGVTQRDLAELPRLLLSYDLACKGCGSVRDRTTTGGSPGGQRDRLPPEGTRDELNPEP